MKRKHKLLILIFISFTAEAYTNNIETFKENVLNAYKSGNAEGLAILIEPLKQAEPVFEDLYGTDTGNKYYSLGLLLSDFFYEDDWDAIEYFLNNGASGFIEDGEGPFVTSYLSTSIINNDVKLLKRLIKAGAKINVDSELGNITPDIEYAIKNKSYDCLEALLELGADPNFRIERNSIGEPGSLVTYSIFNALEDEKALNILLKHGASLDVSQIKKIPEYIDGKNVIAVYKTTLKMVEDKIHTTESVSYE